MPVEIEGFTQNQALLAEKAYTARHDFLESIDRISSTLDRIRDGLTKANIDFKVDNFHVLSTNGAAVEISVAPDLSFDRENFLINISDNLPRSGVSVYYKDEYYDGQQPDDVASLLTNLTRKSLGSITLEIEEPSTDPTPSRPQRQFLGTLRRLAPSISRR